MARFRSTKRAKELKRAARLKAKEARKRERRKEARVGGTDDDIDWSQAVGFPPSEQPSQEDGEPASPSDDEAALSAPDDRAPASPPDDDALESHPDDAAEPPPDSDHHLKRVSPKSP